MSAIRSLSFPCLSPRWVCANDVERNTWNPNVVAPDEMRLLELSIAEDGMVLPIVVYPTGAPYESWGELPVLFTSSRPIRFPVMNVRLAPAAKVVANDYNCNAVADVELELLRLSIDNSGVTQPLVVCYDAALDIYVVVDGFHRYLVLTRIFGATHVPVVVIDRTLEQRMATTWRMNMARGKHQVDLMAELVRKLFADGWDRAKICLHLGMEQEEVFRLTQILGGAAPLEGAGAGLQPGAVLLPPAPLRVVDGFHRDMTLVRRFGCSHLPVVILDRPLAELMAATVEHNRARGKHGSARRAVFVRRLRELGWTNAQIAKHIGMGAEELLRLQVDRSAAEFFSARSFSHAWRWSSGDPSNPVEPVEEEETHAALGDDD